MRRFYRIRFAYTGPAFHAPPPTVVHSSESEWYCITQAYTAEDALTQFRVLMESGAMTDQKYPPLGLELLSVGPS